MTKYLAFRPRARISLTTIGIRADQAVSPCGFPELWIIHRDHRRVGDRPLDWECNGCHPVAVRGNWREMSNSIDPATAVALVAAMVTPALLILASASLLASALVRLARAVDRARVLVAIVHEGGWKKLGASEQQLCVWLDRHTRRTRYAERGIGLLYAAIVVFIATCLSIPLAGAIGPAMNWLPAALAIAGTMLLLAGGAWMVAESRLSSVQIAEELGGALDQLRRPKLGCGA